MVKTLPSALQSHLDTGATTMSYCWRVTRTDGVVLGFTEHDQDLLFDGTTFKAATGFSSTSIEQSMGLNVDNLEVESILSDDSINESDLNAGLFDTAEIELFWVNWSDVDQRILMSKGIIGEVRRGETSFNAELRSLSQKAQQRTGRTYQRYCDANLGDSRCGIDLEDSQYFENADIEEVVDKRNFKTTLASSNDFFTLGKLVFTSGQNNGLEIEVKTHKKSGTESNIELWYEPPYPLSVDDTFKIIVGCKKDHQTCQTKFSNITNFRGFPFIPGNDILQKYPKRGSTGGDYDGGSVVSDLGNTLFGG